ncbi:MAG: ATP-binding protein [Candidatus Brocadiia bacterium]|nr:ATP-binding protein [Candidatus Brocadiia bacterium]
MGQGTDLRTLALDLLPFGVVVADGSGHVVAANKAARIFLELDEQEPAGAMLHCGGRRVCLSEILREHASGSTVRRRLKLEHPRYGWLNATLTQAQGEEDERMVHLMVRLGPRRDWRWAGRSDPLVAFAHEIRNIQTSLSEALNLVADGAAGPLAEPQLHMVRAAREDAARIERLTERMCTTNCGPAASILVSAQRIDLAELARGIVRAFAGVAERKGVSLTFDEANGPVWCYGDSDLLTQAPSNLVTNAMKFTPRGGAVSLSARRLRSPDKEERVELSVRDTGVGLSRSEIDSVFAPSGKARRMSDGGGESGLGVGLRIVRNIAELHGGRLTVDSEPGKGSTFSLVLPPDFRQGEHYLHAEIADVLMLARAIDAPVSVAVLTVLSMKSPKTVEAADQRLEHLPMVEQCLVDNLRPGDSVIVRDDSAILVLYDTDQSGARLVSERVADALAQLLNTLPHPHPQCAISCGIACRPVDGDTAAELLQSAKHRSTRRNAGLRETEVWSER